VNIEEIKKKHIDYMMDRIRSRECCDVVDFSEDVEYLISIVNQAEKALESVANAPARETMRRYAEEGLKAIRG
jgi:hypothetical protein